MAYHASPPRKVTEWTLDAAAAADSLPSVAADFKNLEASYVTHANGFASSVFAVLPDKHQYDRLRFSFGPVTQDTVTSATMAIYARHADGSISLLGTSDLTADGTFPDIEAQNYQATYAAILQEFTGTAISVDVFIQGEHQGYLN